MGKPAIRAPAEASRLSPAAGEPLRCPRSCRASCAADSLCIPVNQGGLATRATRPDRYDRDRNRPVYADCITHRIGHPSGKPGLSPTRTQSARRTRVEYGQDDPPDGTAAAEPDHANAELAEPVAIVPPIVMHGHGATVARPETAAALLEARSSGVVSSEAVLLTGEAASLTRCSPYLFPLQTRVTAGVPARESRARRTCPRRDREALPLVKGDPHELIFPSAARSRRLRLGIVVTRRPARALPTRCHRRCDGCCCRGIPGQRVGGAGRRCHPHARREGPRLRLAGAGPSARVHQPVRRR